MIRGDDVWNYTKSAKEKPQTVEIEGIRLLSGNEQMDQYQATIDRLNCKISRYEEGTKTGVLSRGDKNIKMDSED